MSKIASWNLIYLAITYQGNIFAEACTDKNNYCSYWAKQGECTKNPLYMLHQCPISCNVCFGGVACTNVYNDQYCALHIGNCWNPNYVHNLIKNCKKTCVCSCCSAIPATTIATTTPATTTIPTTTTAATTPTTVRSTNASTTSQTTTEETGEGKTTAPAVTKFSTQTSSKSKGPSSSPTTGDYVHYSEEDPAGRTDKKEFNPMLLAAIIAGVVVVIGILGLSVFCIWRKRRAASSNAGGKSRPSKEPPEAPVTDSPETPLYYALEEPNFPSPSKNQTLSPEYERPFEGLLSDSDYENAVDQGACAVGDSTSKPRDNEPQLYEDVDGYDTKNILYEPSNDDAPNNGGDYCYMYSVANEDLTRVNKNSPQEHPNTQNVYQPLESSNAGYRAPEKETRGDGGYEVMRDIDPAAYVPLKKPTQEQTFYHPLRKEK